MNMLLVAALALTFANDKPDLVYNCGETATFTVTATDKDSPALSGKLVARLDNFGPRKFANETWDLSATNVFTISKYDGIDPEVFGGIDNNMYPRPFSIQAGVTLDF